jgi:hypothetical protein
MLSPGALALTTSVGLLTPESLDRVSARAAETPAGRVRHDLYFTVQAAPLLHPTCGFAASFSGDRFAAAAQPILPLDAEAQAPSETPAGAEALLFYVERFGTRDAIAAAESP